MHCIDFDIILKLFLHSVNIMQNSLERTLVEFVPILQVIIGSFTKLSLCMWSLKVIFKQRPRKYILDFYCHFLKILLSDLNLCLVTLLLHLIQCMCNSKWKKELYKYQMFVVTENIKIENRLHVLHITIHCNLINIPEILSFAVRKDMHGHKNCPQILTLL